jgi:hypothetical protein
MRRERKVKSGAKRARLMLKKGILIDWTLGEIGQLIEFRMENLECGIGGLGDQENR